ncbi:hypothetical protein AOLI_G00313250 [Acnodon oligacanthus]
MPRLTDLDRAQAIGQLQAGVPQNQVAASFGVSPSTISKLKAKVHITGDVRDRPRSGRPKKTTPQEDRFLTLSVLRYRRLSSTDLQSRFAGRYGRRLSAQTIRNRLHAANLRSHQAARRPAMTALHRQARLRWCRQHMHWNLNMWRKVLFSDESRFCLRKLDRRVKVWRRRGDRYADCCTDRVTSFGGGSVMVWGGISLTGKTRLVIIGGNLTAERYRDEILQPVAVPYLHSLGPNSILQDDNTRPHRAGIIRDYLQNLGVERMEWPASSPDLNPIKHLWDHLGRAVRSRVTNTTTLADLQQMLDEEWDAIPQQCVTRLVTSMRRRCQAVVAVYGFSTRY